MTSLNFLFLALSIGILALGGSCLFLVHGPCSARAKFGRRLFLAVLVSLGVVGLVAAIAFHEGLAPLGLLAGLLVVAMCCELPTPELDNQTAQ